MGRAKPTKKMDDGVKKFSLSDQEKARIKRILSTMGFFNVALEGLQYSLEVEQRMVEKRVGVKEAKEGYRLETMIDPDSFELFVREVKIEKPAEVKKEGKK